MRYAVVGLALLVTSCADGPATTAYKAYNECLASKGAERCATEKAQFDAAVTFADAKSRRLASGGIYVPPPVIQTYRPEVQPVSRSGVICTTNGGVTICN